MDGESKENNNEEKTEESREVKRNEEERLSWNRYSSPCSNWISRGPSSISDKDLLFKSNVLRKLLIRRDRRTANASAAANPFFWQPHTPCSSSGREFNEG